MDEQRSLLDSLMGIDRDACGKEREKRSGESFKDSKVCKCFLVGFCPNELFKNTKRELGPCQYLHNDHVLSEFESHPDVEELTKKYERNLKSFLEDIVREADRWIEREKRNARKPPPDVNDLLTDDEKEQIEKLNAAAADLIARAEVDAEEGNFELSEQKTAHALQAKQSAEGLRERRMQIYMKREEANGAICEICGIRTEVEQSEELAAAAQPGAYPVRRPRHEEGKVHQGYIKVRAKIIDLEERERARRAARQSKEDRTTRHRSGDEPKDRREEDKTKDAKAEDVGSENKRPESPDHISRKKDTEDVDGEKGDKGDKDKSRRRSRSRPDKDRSRRRSRSKHRDSPSRRSRDRRQSRSRRESSRDRRKSRSRRDRSRRRRSYGRRR